MGVAISLFNSLFGKKTVRILMAGLDGAGKTSILYKLMLGEVVNPIPTIGHNLETVQYKNILLTIWDIGGGYKIRHAWQYYFNDIDGIIYVVDSNDRERIDEAADELHNIVLNVDKVKDCVLLVFANKQDLPNAMSADEITDKLKLNTLKERTWYVQAVSVNEGNGLYEGFDWLSNELSKK